MTFTDYTRLNLKLEIVKNSKQQYKIAKDANIPESKLSNIVNGWIRPKKDEKLRIAEALGYKGNLEELFKQFVDKKHT